ncbi:MAG: topoisomerase [Chloroflexota bacterium]|nr:topoisomerase [Chloroflexota bacterium]
MADPRASAEAAGLRYVTDGMPGIQRHRSGKGFRYTWPDGTPVKDAGTTGRIKKLAIPPAYRDVWICQDPSGHLQAVGWDDRGRKQYRYHEEWRTVRDAVKFHRMIAFGEALPAIRERVAADLRKHGLPRDKVLAAVVTMLEQTLVRVGNEQYRQQNESYGVTTLRNRHVRISGGRARFRFKGKSGKEHDVRVDNPRLVRIVRQCMDIPGQELFQWLEDDGTPRVVGSDDVNQYLKEISGQDFTAKDFRTWAATVLAARLLRATAPGRSERASRAEVNRVIKEVAEQLRNTPAVCRKSYIHPVVLEAYSAGHIRALPPVTGAREEPERSVEEDALLELLREGAATISGGARAAGSRATRAAMPWTPKVLRGR